MKKDDEAGEDFYRRLDKSTVLQEARIFNETPIKPSKCCQTLTKVLYLLYQGESLQTMEATDLFFSVTKLFQSKDTQMRKLVYLVIKELANVAQNVMMATSILNKDMNDRVAAEIGYKSNALRTLCTIIEPSMVQNFERFIKQAIVDKDASVSSAALVASSHLFQKGSREVVKRWFNEIQEALQKPNGLIQYHALGLMFLIRQHDKMAVLKIIQQLSKKNHLKSPLANCMLIRYTYKVMEDEGGLEGPHRDLFEILENCLRHRYEMVNLEAARAICQLTGVKQKELFPAVSFLQLILSSPKSSLRFSAIRTLNKLAATNPGAVTPCNFDIENLITDSNRSIATFAITTLLKTGNEASVDRLMKQISGFMSEISDEFKVIVVDAIRTLCLKFPSKQSMLLQFLYNQIRDETGGSYEYKKALVEGIFDIINTIPESKETGLTYLCECIEDCEFSRIAVRILHLLGEEGPKMSNPTKYIKYIYNRTILESASVRAAAVSALAQFAVKLGGKVEENIRILLERCLEDPDDEVRDRAVFYLNLNPKVVNEYVILESTYAMDVLENQLSSYLEAPSHDAPFEIKTVPELSKVQEKELKIQAKTTQLMPSPQPQSQPKTQQAVSGISQVSSSKEIEKIPEFQKFGPCFKSSKPVPLTEADVAEYVVYCVKHMFEDYIVFQFNCENTLDDVMLENVNVLIESDDLALKQQLKPVCSIASPRLAYQQPSQPAYIAFNKLAGKNGFPVGFFTTTLKFVSKDCDPSTGQPDEEGYDDSYQMDELELSLGDYIQPTFVPQFQPFWEQLPASSEQSVTLQLSSFQTIPDASKAILEMLQMQPTGDESNIQKDKTLLNHVLLVSGIFLGGSRCGARLRMAVSGAAGVTMELTVRSEREELTELIMENIG